MKNRRILTALPALALLVAIAWPVASQERREEALPERTVVIDVDSPERALYRIAVPNLVAEGTAAQQGADTLRNDFRLVSLFEVLDARSFVANLGTEGLSIVPSAWSTVGAQGVIKGQVTREGSNIRVEMRLYEVARGTTAVLTRTYSGAPGELRQFMHQFANEVMQLLTGRAGAFGTRITFARRRGPGRKDVMVASFDGESVNRVSSGNGISMLPSFGRGGVWYSVLSPSGMFITRSGTSDRPIIQGNGLNMGVSVCGDRAYFTSTRDGNSEIYSANLDGGDVRRLTNSPAIDVSPACGGPGGQIAFVSSRHGSPQIFTMPAGGGAATRVTYRGAHNQTPAWCPSNQDGPLLAFTGQSTGFDVFTVNLRTQQYTRLTQGQGTNKDPAFSPDCRMVAFYSSRGGIFLSSPEGLNQNLVIPGHAETLRWSR
jgi:TolB protein